MSWYTGDNRFHIKAENFVDAQKALDKVVGADYDGSIHDGLERAGWKTEQDNKDIIGLEAHDINIEGVTVHTSALKAITPFVERGSYIRLLSEDADSNWLGICIRFQDGKVVENDLISWTVEEDSIDDMMETLQSTASILLKLGAPLEDLMKLVSEAGVKKVMDE